MATGYQIPSPIQEYGGFTEERQRQGVGMTLPQVAFGLNVTPRFGFVAEITLGDSISSPSSTPVQYWSH